MAGTRLNASVEAAGLIRRAESEGGFGAVLREGDPERGSLILVVRSRDGHVTCLERALDFASGEYRWAQAGPAADADSEILADFLNKRARFDEDSWLIELDVAHPERFIAETMSAG